jgi:hypothetical protein
LHQLINLKIIKDEIIFRLKLEMAEDIQLQFMHNFVPFHVLCARGFHQKRSGEAVPRKLALLH